MWEEEEEEKVSEERSEWIPPLCTVVLHILTKSVGRREGGLEVWPSGDVLMIHCLQLQLFAYTAFSVNQIHHGIDKMLLLVRILQALWTCCH